MSKQKHNDELQRSIKELSSKLDENLPILNSKIKELKHITDELESIHKTTTVGSLVGTSVGLAAGLGLALVPFTFGVSLALTAAGIAGGVTGAAFGITNKVKQKNLCQTISKILNDFQNIINPIFKHLNTISNIIEEIQKRQQVSGSDLFPIIVSTVETVLGISSISIELQMARIGNVARRTLQMAGRITGVLSALLFPFDVYFIVQDSIEISEMNQLANKKKTDIKSDTLKFIHQMRETTALFQETVDELDYCARNCINIQQCVNCGGVH